MAPLSHFIPSTFSLFLDARRGVHLASSAAIPPSCTFAITFLVILFLVFIGKVICIVLRDQGDDDEAAFPPCEEGRPLKSAYAETRQEALRTACAITVAELVRAQRNKDAQAAVLAADLEQARATMSAHDATYAALQARIAELECDRAALLRQEAGRGAVERALEAQIAKLEEALDAAADDTAQTLAEHRQAISRLEAEHDDTRVCLLVTTTARDVGYQLVAEKAAHIKQLSEAMLQMRTRLRLKNKNLKSRVAELEKNQDARLIELVQETDAQKDQLQALNDEKEVLLSMLAEARLEDDEQRSIIAAGKEAFSEENDQLKALVEQLRGTIASLTTEKADLAHKAADQETLLMELIEESNDQKDMLDAATVEKDLLLSVAAEDELALTTEKSEAVEAAAMAQAEVKRLEAALEVSSITQHELSAQLASAEATSEDYQVQIDIQTSAFAALEKDMSALEIKFEKYVEATDARVCELDELIADKTELAEQVDEKDAVIAALRERIEHLESKLENQFWSSSRPAAQPASFTTKDTPLITPPATPESSDSDFDDDDTWPSDLPPMTSSSTKVTDRQRPILRAGVLVREALKFCHAPLPRVDVEELAHRLPAPVEYRPYALRDGWRSFHKATRIPSPLSNSSGLRSTSWGDEDDDDEVTSPTPSKVWVPKSPSSPNRSPPLSPTPSPSLSPSRIPVFCPMF